MAAFYDTHAHLSRPEFAGDLPQVIARAGAAGVTRIITIGTDLESSERAVKLAEEYPQVYAVAGWHPSEAAEAPEDVRPALRKLARHGKVVALGETGLDYYRLPSHQAGFTAEDEARCKARQAELFRQHLEVAVEVGSMFIPDGPIVYIKNRGEEPRPLKAIPGRAQPPSSRRA